MAKGQGIKMLGLVIICYQIEKDDQWYAKVLCKSFLMHCVHTGLKVNLSQYFLITAKSILRRKLSNV